MFCRNCGEQIEEGNAFCANCGERINKEVIEQQIYTAKKGRDDQKRKNRIIGIIATAIVAVIVAVVIVKVIGLFNGGYEKVIEKYIKAIQEDDGELLCSLYPPEIIENAENYNKEELTEVCKGIKEDFFEGIENHQDIEYDIISVESGESELESLNEQMKEEMGITVDEIYSIDLEVSMGEVVCDDTCVIVKIRGKWYMLMSQMVTMENFQRALEGEQ